MDLDDVTINQQNQNLINTDTDCPAGSLTPTTRRSRRLATNKHKFTTPWALLYDDVSSVSVKMERTSPPKQMNPSDNGDNSDFNSQSLTSAGAGVYDDGVSKRRKRKREQREKDKAKDNDQENNFNMDTLSLAMDAVDNTIKPDDVGSKKSKIKKMKVHDEINELSLSEQLGLDMMEPPSRNDGNEESRRRKKKKKKKDRKKIASNESEMAMEKTDAGAENGLLDLSEGEEMMTVNKSSGMVEEKLKSKKKHKASIQNQKRLTRSAFYKV